MHNKSAGDRCAAETDDKTGLEDNFTQNVEKL